MGDLRSRLIAVHKIDFSANPSLLGIVPPRLWEAPFLEVVHCNFASLWPLDNATDDRAKAQLTRMTQLIMEGDEALTEAQRLRKYEHLPLFLHATYRYRNFSIISHAYTARMNQAATLTVLRRHGVDEKDAKGFSFLLSELHDLTTALFDRASLRQQLRNATGHMIATHEEDVYNKLPSMVRVAVNVPVTWTWHVFSKMSFREAMRTWYQLYFILTA
ncbi:hypothetical protein STCU_09985 [Strigomonas culicis]|uniref:Uncharacterized protein n=1 Tax=Strigomonas culicis TaxID=28005 RepID=S9TPL2_9TRYP|nr:hypothetical protein STCU_09985 [Strigomonas culicis]|eukprot:EPY18398.1 hypothetical protein STCU_09985 [Strigomonas culicis]